MFNKLDTWHEYGSISNGNSSRDCIPAALLIAPLWKISVPWPNVLQIL